MGDPNENIENLVLKKRKMHRLVQLYSICYFPFFYLRVVNIEAIIYYIFIKICFHIDHVEKIYYVVMLSLIPLYQRDYYRNFMVLFFLQVEHGSLGDVTTFPTFIINDKQYRGWCPYFLYILSFTNARIKCGKLTCSNCRKIGQKGCLKGNLCRISRNY